MVVLFYSLDHHEILLRIAASEQHLRQVSEGSKRIGLVRRCLIRICAAMFCSILQLSAHSLIDAAKTLLHPVLEYATPLHVFTFLVHVLTLLPAWHVNQI